MKAKVNAEDVLALFDNIKALLKGLGDGFRECEDRFQCGESFDTINGYIQELLSEFRINHISGKSTQRPDQKAPYFVVEYLRIFNRKVLRSQESICLNRNEERIWFMNKFYKAIKEKLVVDGVDHLYSREKIHYHIYQYLVYNDRNLNRQLESEFAASALQVIEAIVDEIIKGRMENPQLALDFPEAGRQDSNTLLDGFIA